MEWTTVGGVGASSPFPLTLRKDLNIVHHPFISIVSVFVQTAYQRMVLTFRPMGVWWVVLGSTQRLLLHMGYELVKKNV